MTIFPVLDLLDGMVVRGVAGRRDEYRPIASRLVSRPDPLAVARAFRSAFGLTELYVADLDAILHERPNGDVYRSLAEEGFSIMVDAGLRDLQRAREFLESGAAAVIAGLETSPGPEHLRQLCEAFGPDRVIFSLDLKAGRPMISELSEGWHALSPRRAWPRPSHAFPSGQGVPPGPMGDPKPWETNDPFEIAERAVAEGITRMIVLDVAQVGTSGGVSTISLCNRLRDRFPDLRLITGGGIRSIEDMRPLQELGVEGILIASALHDGRISPKEIAALCRGEPE